MNSADPHDPPPGATYRLLGLLVVSGFAGIALEIAWFRRLHLVLGSESYSVALMLAAFMAGLGLGSHLFGRMADRMPPLVLYRRLELGIGLYALASPWLLDVASVPYVFLRSSLGLSGGPLLFAKFALSFVLLLPPTLLMGGTLPAAARALTGRFSERGRAFALGYGTNAFGAGLAAISAPFLLLPHLGLVRTMFLAGACNLFVFVAARGFHLAGETAEERGSEADDPAVDPAEERRMRLLVVPFFVTGFVALAAETVWNRVFSFFFTSSVYTFSLILFTYLATLAAGSLSFPLVRRRFRDAGAVFVGCQFLIAVLLAVSTVFLDRAPLVLLAVFDGDPLSFARFLTSSAVTLVAFTAPITYLFGLAFPAGVAAATTHNPRLGRDIGRLLLWNTFGTAVASIVVTFVLFGTLGSRMTLVVLAALTVVGQLVAAHALGLGRQRVVAAATAAIVLLTGALTSWDLRNFHLRLAQRPQDAVQARRDGTFAEFRAGANVVAFEDGPAAAVSVVNIQDLYPSLFINGKPEASENFFDMGTQYLSGLIPVLMRPGASGDPRTLVIGLGSGATTNAAEAAGAGELVSVEISEGVIDLAERFFQKSNEGVLERTRLVVDDGRNYLISTEGRYDVIISEPSNPWISGIAYLFTDEFFAHVASKLNEGGVFCQWIHHYSMTADAVYGVPATLRRHFDDVHAFHLPSGDILFLASNAPIAVDWDRMANPPERAETMLRSLGYEDPTEVLRLYLWDPAIVHGLESSYPPNRDDLPWLEFDAPRFMFSAIAESNLPTFVRRLDRGTVRAPVRLPSPSAATPTVVPVLDVDVAGLPSDMAEVDLGLDVRWTIRPDSRVDSRGWLTARYEAPDGSYYRIRSPLIRKPPTVEEAVQLLRADLGPATRITEGRVRDHVAVLATSPEHPDRAMAFWYCGVTRRNYLVERGTGDGSPAGAAVDVPCAHGTDGGEGTER